MVTGEVSAAADDVHDLDLDGAQDGGGAGGGAGRDAGGDGPLRRLRTPWPAAVPGWARGPVAALAVVLAVAVLAATITATHLATTQAARLQTLQARLSLQVGQPQTNTVPGSDAASTSRVDLDIPLLDRGPDPLTVSILGVTGDFQRAAHASAAVRIASGDTETVPLELVVDCSDVPDPNAEDTQTSPPLEVPSLMVVARVAVASGGAGTTPVTVRLPTFQDAAEQLRTDLGETCHPYLGGRYSASWTYPADGSAQLRLSNENDSGTPALALALTQTPGLRATSRPELPLTVPPGSEVEVALDVDPDCALVGDGTHSYLGIGIPNPDGTLESDFGVGYSSSDGQDGTVAWLARRIALRCG